MKEKMKKLLHLFWKPNPGPTNILIMLVATILIVTIVMPIIPLVGGWTPSNAASYLEDRGYTVLAASEYNAIIDAIGDVQESVDEIYNELLHRSYLFPDLSSNIDLTCIFTSGAIDTFGTWAEITDSGDTTLGSVIAAEHAHITALRIRTTSVADVLYVIELGYGPDAAHVTTIDVHDFGSGTKKIDSDEQRRVRAPNIPQGQKVWYRMKTEDNANATAGVILRYHYD